MPSQPIDVLLVEDNPADARLLVESLKDAGPDAFKVRVFTRLAAALDDLARKGTDVVALDLTLPDSGGLDTVRRVQTADPGVPVVVLTGLQDESLALEAVRQGVQDYLVKGQCESGIAARALRYAVERRRAEAALRAAEEQLRTITDAVPALIGFADTSGRFQLNNQSYESWFGVPRSQITGRQIGDVLGAAAWEKARPRFERALAGEEVHFEDLLPYASGGPRWVSVNYTPYRDPSGAVRGVVVLVNDISGRKAAEEALRESERRSNLAQRAGGIGIFDWNLHTGRSVWTAEQEAIYGLHPGGFAGTHRDWADRVHPDDRPWVTAQMERWFAERRPDNEMEYRIVRADGEVRWVSNRGVAIYDAEGRPLRAIGTTIDVTDRRRAEEALRDREARLQAVVDTAVDSIIAIDERGIIDTVNPATERMFGYGRDEMVGRNVSMLMPDPYHSEHDEYIQRYLRTGAARIIGVGRELVGLRKDGGTFPLDLSVSEFQVGGRRMFTGILHDISNRRRLEREILDASANEQRRVGRELHDGLCQQLTGVAFSAEILVRKLEAKAPDLVPHVRKLADEVDNAITQTRTLARGLNPVEIHADSLGPALEDLANKVSDSFGVSCRFNQKGDGEAVAADNNAATHLFRIAQEAISNAIRHGGAKKIELRLQADAGSLTLSVSDDGEGFASAGWSAAPQGAAAGIGLQTMSYRAKMLNGILDVRPGRRRGIVVTCSVPRGSFPRATG